MRIARPIDWQDIDTTAFDVIVEGAADDRMDCRLYATAGFFGVAPEAWQALACATVRLVAPGVAHARFAGVRSWGDCVIALFVPGTLTLLGASGVRLGSVATRHWLRKELVLSDAEAASGVVAPAPVVSCALSHIPAEAAEPVATVASLEALLAPAAAAVTVLPLLGSEVLDAHQVLDDCRCTGPDQDRADRLLAEAPYLSSAPYLAALRDGVVLLPGGVVLPEGNRIWSDSTHAAFWLDPDLVQYPALFRLEGGIGFVPDRLLTEQALLDDNELAALPGIPLLAFGNAWRNHGHWLMNTVFAAYLLRDAIAAGRVCVLVPALSDYVVDTLRAAGVPRRAMVLARAGGYRFGRALFPSTLSIHANKVPPRAMAGMFRAMAAQGGGAVTDGPERIYITRLGSPTQRWISNEAALIAALQDRGFTCIAPHELTVAQEIRCFANARVVVGQLGAGLLNVGFAPPGCRVVEIVSHNYAVNDVWFLCGVLGHRFSRLMVHGPSDEILDVTAFRFEVPLAPALALIDDVLGRMEAGLNRPEGG